MRGQRDGVRRNADARISDLHHGAAINDVLLPAQIARDRDRYPVVVLDDAAHAGCIHARYHRRVQKR